MQITDIRTRYLKLPDPKVSGDNLQDILIIEVQTSEGIVGIGEVHTNPIAARAIIEYQGYHTSSRGMKELLIGENPLDIGQLWDKMYSFTQSYGRRGLAINVISGIDIALWDILGKSCGKPIYQILAGAQRKEIPAYASDLTPPTIEETVELAVRHVSSGYHGVKIGWGRLGSDIRSDINRVKAVREAVGPSVALMVDLGMPLPLEDAVYLGMAYAEYGVYFMEEPLSPDDMRGWKSLIARSETPIATGEKETTRFGFAELIDQGGLQIIQPDVARAGGITECLRIANYAEMRGVRVIPHCWSSDILVAATMHLITTLKDCPFLEYNAMTQPLRTDLISNPIRPENGIVRVPEGPGLGIELDPGFVAKFEIN